MQDYTRKLAAIFSADVAGYSRLMGDDESATVKTLTAYREVMYALIKQNRGRVVDSPGDNLLAEFASVVDAAQCGVAIQKEIQSRNSPLPENRRMQFRIGINLGDVIEEGERIYGDGVNIAARLEALADPGGICISKTAFDHIESKLPLGYEYIGEQTVKNISRPVSAYKVIMDPRITSGDSIKKGIKKSLWARRNIFIIGVIAVLFLAIIFIFGTIPRCSGPQSGKKQGQKPSIVILPFKNISGDPKQEPFSDGITEELIHSLSRIKGLKVISSTSSFYYKGKDLPLSTIGEELSVDYALEGSVKKDDKNILIYSQLISVADDTHLFSQRYDRELKDIFSVQEEISKAVASELKIGLMDTEYEDEEKYSIVEHERRMGLNVVIDDNEIITGGLLATGANIYMAGSVKGGLKAYGAHVVISGTSQDVVDFWAGNATLSGNFKDKVKGAGGDIIISGTFEKDLEIHAKHITITSSAVINGDFYYSGMLERDDGSQIGGEVTELAEVSIAPWAFLNPPQEKSTFRSLLMKINWDINNIILGILVYFFFPIQKEKILSAISSESSLKTIGKGILFFIVSPFIIFISMISFVGIFFGAIYSCFLTILVLAGPVFGCLWVGRKLLNFIKLSFAGNFFISLITGIIVIRVLQMIPFVGWLALVIPFLMSVGAMLHVIWTALKSQRMEATLNNDNSTV